MYIDHASLECLAVVLRDVYDPLRRQVHGDPGVAPIQVSEHTDSDRSCQFGERFLQVVWNEGRLSLPARTVDGRSVGVVNAGTWNVSSGPDFQDAVLTIDGRMVAGDVEIHRSEADWVRHGHDRDSRYAGVILHVVWQADSGDIAEGIPCLALCECVDSHWRSLLRELEVSVYPYARQVRPGACAVRWALSDDDTVRRILDIAGLARFEDKSMRIWRRAVSVGPSQALYEAAFDSLGYKSNRDAFRGLARGVPLQLLRGLPDSLSREAMLFGSGGLLPDPSVRPVLPRLRDHLLALWDRWWTLGAPRLDLRWQRSGTRPFNSPERRLAAGTCWLERTDYAPDSWVVGLLERSGIDRFVGAVHEGMAIRGRWVGCKDFSCALRKPAVLVGSARINDLLANVFLPFLAAASQAGHTSSCVGDDARRVYLGLPSLQDNRLMKEAIHRFLVPPSRSRALLRHASSQQGLLEIYRTFCLALHGDCDRCPFSRFEGG